MKRHDLVMKYEETKLFVIKYGMQNVWIRMQLKVRFKNTCLVIKIRDTNVFQFYSKKYIFIIHF